MEQEELELINRLKNTQLVQKQAYDELEAALSSAAVSPLSSSTSRGSFNTKMSKKVTTHGT